MFAQNIGFQFEYSLMIKYYRFGKWLVQFFKFLSNNASWLAAGVLLTFVSSFGQTFFISIFGGQIRTEFGLSHAAWGGIYSLGTTASAIVMIWSGVLSDFFRTRIVGGIVLVGLACACLGMAFISSAFFLPVVIFALRLFGQGMCSHLAVVAMSRWFVANRGRALSIAGLGFSVGEAFMPIIFVFLITIVAWQKLWLVAATLSFLAVPALWRLLRQERTPQSMSEENTSLGMKGKHWSRIEALRHPLFWFMFPAILGQSAFNTAFFFHQVHFAQTKGWDHFLLFSFFPVYTGISVLMMLLSGWALDRFGTARIIPFFQVPMVVAFLCFAIGDGVLVFGLGLIFLSMTSGATATLPNAFWAEFYGTGSLGSIKALAAAVSVLGSAMGPGITGFLIDQGVELEMQYFWIAGFFAICVVALYVGVARSKPQLVLSPAPSS